MSAISSAGHAVRLLRMYDERVCPLGWSVREVSEPDVSSSRPNSEWPSTIILMAAVTVWSEASRSSSLHQGKRRYICSFGSSATFRFGLPRFHLWV
jgi:hypothetical protein